MENNEKRCNLNYLSEMMGGKKHLIREILDAFLKQFPQDLESINEAILENDYITIKNTAHSMKSSVSIIGASIVLPILNKIEELARKEENIQLIEELGNELTSICKEIIVEIKNEYNTFSE